MIYSGDDKNFLNFLGLERRLDMKGAATQRIFHLFIILSFLVAFPASGIGADRLIIKDSTSATTFSIEDTGQATSQRRLRVQGITPAFWLDETDGTRGANFVLDGSIFQIQMRALNYGAFESSPFKIAAAAETDAFVIRHAGAGDDRVGFGVPIGAVLHPLEMKSGAHVTKGGDWISVSTRQAKENIAKLSSEDALNTIKGLEPVTFTYKLEPGEKKVGFIAEDVPELVASSNRKGLSTMTIVATLTKVVQEQQKTIDSLTAELDMIKKNLSDK
jgi:hypothetical protein